MVMSMPSAPAVPTRGSLEAGILGSLTDKDSVSLLLYTYKPNGHANGTTVHPSPLPSSTSAPNVASSQVLINYAALPWPVKPGDYLEIRQIHRRTSAQSPHPVNEPEGETYMRKKKNETDGPAMSGVKLGRGRDGYVFRLGDDQSSASAHQIQVPDSVATAFGFQQRLEVEVRRVLNKESAHTDYVEFYFSQYLGRADMWRLGMSLEGMTLHVGEKVSLAGGAVRAEVNFIIRPDKDPRTGRERDKRFSSGIVTAKTKTIFRSKSAQVYLFIQLCQETWEFDEDGERYIEKVVHGYLPDLFSRWAEKGTSHVVTIIYFARIYYSDSDVEYLERHGMTDSLIKDYSGRWCKDFFKVAVDLERRNDWTKALPEIKKQLEKSEADILLDYHFQLLGGKDYKGDEVKIVGRWSFAYEGNALEAVNIALNPFDEHHVDRDLSRTGLSISIITPGTGHFAVDKNLLRLTTERMVDHGMAVDFVCLTKMPLHSVPLFSYVSHRPKGSSDENPASGKARPLTPDLLYFDASMSNVKATELADCYSLPSWVSCSFYAVTHDKPFRPERFIPRCKMYEIQMLGILDHNMTTVIVPYLNVEDVPMPRRPLSLDDRKAIRDDFDQSIFSSGQPVSAISQVGTPQPESMPASIAASYQSARLLAEKVKEHRSASMSSQKPKVGPMGFGGGTRLSPIRALVENEDNGIGKKRTDLLGASPAPSSLSLRKGQRSSSPPKATNGLGLDTNLLHQSPLLTATRADSPNTTTRSTSPLPHSSVPRIQEPEMDNRPSQPPTRDASPSRSSSISVGPGSGVSTPKSTPAKKLNTKSSKSSFASRFGASWLFGSLTSRPQPSYAAPAIKTVGRTDVSSVTGTRPSSPTSSISELMPPTAPKVKGKAPKLPNPDAVITPSTPSPSRDKQSPLPPQGTQPVPIATGGSPRSRLRRSQPTDEDQVSRSLRNSRTAHPHSGGGGLSKSFEDSSWRNRNNALVQSSRHFTINPCKPTAETIGRVRDAGGRRWRFVLPKQTQQHIVQWPSLISTACLPLTTDFLPNQKQSDELYTTGTYTVQCYLEDGAFLIRSDAAEANLPLAMMREMVSQRLSQNFQVIVLPHERAEPGLARPMPIHLEKDADIGVELVSGGASEVLKNGRGAIWMSWANHIHRLLFHPTKQEIIVHWMTRKVSHSTDPVAYRCLVWPNGLKGYQPTEATFNYPDVNTKVNYNHLDHLINGERRTLDPLRYWRTRFILIPSGKEIGSFPGLVPQGEHLNQTDLLWLGAQKVIETLNRYLMKKPENQGGTPQAPLRIVTTTFDPSTCVLDEELMMDLERQISGKEKVQGPGTYLEGMTLTNVAEMMRQPGNGLVIRTRWWESRQHIQSFTGAQFCEWLQNTFEDITTREKAAEWAESLLEKGLIEHVTNSHGFLDYWHLYYRLREPYNESTKKESKPKSWFGTGSKTATSATKDDSTPASNGNSGTASTTGSSSDGTLTVSNSGTTANGSGHNTAGANTPMNGPPATQAFSTTPPEARAMLAKMYDAPKERKGGRKRKVRMSQTRVLDLDPNRKSDRAEVAILHADVVHNARNAFHFELNWLGVTAALLEELRQKLSAQAERYGLRFVETPVEQLVDLPLKCAYRTAIPIKLAIPPPVIPDLHARLLSIAHGTGQVENYFEYCILTRKFGFVLDVEAYDRYPDNVDVVYSYRKSRFDHSQFCHKTGLALVQCLGGDEGFLWSDNRMVVSAPTRRGVGNRTEEARALRSELEEFCNDRVALQAFYDEVLPPLPGEQDDGREEEPQEGHEEHGRVVMTPPAITVEEPDEVDRHDKSASPSMEGDQEGVEAVQEAPAIDQESEEGKGQLADNAPSTDDSTGGAEAKGDEGSDDMTVEESMDTSSEAG
ncbi:hypothetical protein IAU60_000868 [Kwoniella sp. DSM 27419]